MRKICILFSIITILLSGASFAEMGNIFSDVSETHWAKSSIDHLYELEIISGYPDGTFKPENNVKINEFIAMIIKSMGYEFEPMEENWAKLYIEQAIKLGIIERDQYERGSFIEETSDMNRQEMIRIAMDALSVMEGLPLPSIENQFIKFDVKDIHNINMSNLDNIVDGYRLGIITGYPDGTFNPMGDVKRSEAAKVLVAMLKPDERNPYDGNPYENFQVESTMIPVTVWKDQEGKNVGFTYIWNFESTIYSLYREYDENGNWLETVGNALREYSPEIEYVEFLAPIFHSQPLNEVVEIAEHLLNVKDQGKGNLRVHVNHNLHSINASGYKSRDYFDSIFEDEKRPIHQSFLFAERMDFSFGFNPFNSHTHQFLPDNYRPYDFILWKKSSHIGEYETYENYFLARYGDQIKPIFEILFEGESEKAWGQFVEALNYEGKDVRVEEVINGRAFKLNYSGGSISFYISLKQE